MYIYEHVDWPKFTWDAERISPLLLEIRYSQGLLMGGMEVIGFSFQEEATLQAFTQDALKTSAIEGEILDQAQVRSSVARRLGIEDGAIGAPNRNVEGIVEILLDATQKYDFPLTKERLFDWHAALFPLGRSGLKKLFVAEWRKGAVQVVSGPIGKEKIHFEGPPANQVDREMAVFFQWINEENRMDLVLKAAIAHLWFVTIHPFEDGNGRIGRAIIDLLLARSEKISLRFYSLSGQIQAERKGYYRILEQTQKGSLEITPWLEWFLGCLKRAIEKAITTLEAVKWKDQIWKEYEKFPLNERQKKLINRLLDGFEGLLTTSKWAKIAKCSQDSAYRDILALVEFGILVKDPKGGRSTSYSLSRSMGKFHDKFEENE